LSVLSASDGSRQGHSVTSFISAVAIEPNGKTLAAGDNKGFITFFDIPSLKSSRTFQAHERGIWSLAFSLDGRNLASSGYDERLRIWEVATGGLINESQDLRGNGQCISFSPDGRYLAIGGGPLENKHGELIVYDCGSWAVVNRIPMQSPNVAKVVFSNGSKTVISKIRDGPVQEWDVSSGNEIRSFSVSPLGPSILSLSSDGKLLLVGDKQFQGESYLSTIVGLDFQTAAKVFTIVSAGQIAISDDGQLLAVARGRRRGSTGSILSGLGQLDVYGLPRGNLIASYKESGYIESPVFVPKSHTVVAGGGLPEGPGHIYVYRPTNSARK
jgi:WD40 repeat protein